MIRKTFPNPLFFTSVTFFFFSVAFYDEKKISRLKRLICILPLVELHILKKPIKKNQSLLTLFLYK